MNLSALKFSLAALLFAAFVGCSQPAEDASPFVSVENGQFIRNGKPYYFVGANFWYGAILASQGQGGNRTRLAAELDSLQSIGVDNLRILVGGDGENGLPSRIQPTLQTAPGVYNDTILDGLDYLMAELGKRNMLAVLYLNNSWEWSGGYSVYLQWSGHGQAPIPSVDGWPTFMEYVKQYMQSDSAKQLFANHVDFILKRTNRYTGKPYAEDPAIMSWQVGNEPRCFADENKEAFVVWLRSVSSQIRSLDANHMISVGSEGKHGCEQDIDLYDRISADENISYINAHIWPYNWGWANRDSLAENLDRSIENTAAYINLHLDVAKRHQKPLVIEEFGFPRDGFQFARGTSTAVRDQYYKFIFSTIEQNAAEGGLFAGCNFWAWGGDATLSSEHTFWAVGDDYTGDPAQEEQGLNSVFSDDSTVGIIREANRTLAQ